MRGATTVFLWLVTTALLLVALPAMWAQHNLIDRSGYAALAQRAAADPGLQSAMAAELTAQVGRLGAAADSTVVGAVARAYTASPAFPRQFGQANGYAHRWLFTDTVVAGVDEQGRWVIDLAPMLADAAFAPTLRQFDISLPSSVPIPLTDNAPAMLRPGALREVGFWGPWLAWGLAALTAASAVLTLFVARRRGRTLTALGISALLAGALGWAGIELSNGRIGAALDNTSGGIRTVADAMVSTAQDSLHQWLNLTLVVGGGLVIVGVLVSLLEGLARRD